MKNKTNIWHVFTNGQDEYITPAEGGEKAAIKLFRKFARDNGCARIYFRPKGEVEESDGECIKSFGPFPN